MTKIETGASEPWWRGSVGQLGAGVEVDAGPDHRPAGRATYAPGRLKAWVIGADLVAVALGMVAAYLITTLIPQVDSRDTAARCLLIGGVSLPLWVVIFTSYRLYSARCVSIALIEAGRLVHAILMSVLTMTALAYITQEAVPRSWTILCFSTTCITCLLERHLTRATFARLRRSGRMLRRVVMVGANDEARSICDMLGRSPELGYRVVGMVDYWSTPTVEIDTDLGRLVEDTFNIQDTLDAVRDAEATGVIVAATAVTPVSANRLVRELTDAGVHVELSTSLRDVVPERLRVQALGPCSVMYVEPVRRGGWRAAAKRTFDIVGSSVGLVSAAPLLLVAGLTIVFGTPGGAFFSQVRVGRNGKPFRLHKLRTMVHDAELLRPSLQHRNNVDGPLFKLIDDPRVTPIGKVLRRYSIDEIPQLWNVLRGDMSLVGPRPALPSEMEQWAPQPGRARLRVRPGLTGMWQVSGRSNLSFSDYVRLDLYYVDNWSLWRDLAIVAKTVPNVMRRSGAY